MTYARYGVYFLPSPGAFASFGAAWVGWDVETGQPHAPFDIAGLTDITTAPRKYGFHATLKPPFSLVEGKTPQALRNAVAGLAKNTAPARADGLQVTALGRFLALTPVGDAQEIRQVAASCVTELDDFRAPATEDELQKRRAAGLTPAQDALLLRWGYPYVLNGFRFHMTLTDRLPKADIPRWIEQIDTFLPELPQPFELDAICLVGERPDKQFELIERFPLLG